MRINELVIEHYAKKLARTKCKEGDDFDEILKQCREYYRESDIWFKVKESANGMLAVRIQYYDKEYFKRAVKRYKWNAADRTWLFDKKRLPAYTKWAMHELDNLEKESLLVQFIDLQKVYNARFSMSLKERCVRSSDRAFYEKAQRDIKEQIDKLAAAGYESLGMNDLHNANWNRRRDRDCIANMRSILDVRKI